MTPPWRQALEQLDAATARLESAIPHHMQAVEEALALRESAIAQIAVLPPAPEVAEVLRLLLVRGGEAARRLRLARAQLALELGHVEQQRLLLRALDRSGSHDSRPGCFG